MGVRMASSLRLYVLESLESVRAGFGWWIKIVMLRCKKILSDGRLEEREVIWVSPLSQIYLTSSIRQQGFRMVG